MKISIVGLSSISVYFYCRLVGAGMKCKLFSKSIHDTAQTSSIQIDHINELTNARGCVELCTTTEIEEDSDLIIVCTTASNLSYYINNTILGSISRRIPCLFFQNGIGLLDHELRESAFVELRKIICSVNGLSTRLVSNKFLSIRDKQPCVSYYADEGWEDATQDAIEQVLLIISGGHVKRMLSPSRVILSKLVKTGPHAIASAFELLKGQGEIILDALDPYYVFEEVFKEYCAVARRVGGVEEKDMKQAKAVLGSLVTDKVSNSIARRLLDYGLEGSEFRESVLDVIDFSEKLGCHARATLRYSEMILSHVP